MGHAFAYAILSIKGRRLFFCEHAKLWRQYNVGELR